MSEEISGEEMGAVEGTGPVPFLRALRPARPDGLNRDQIMYEAGRAAAARAGRRQARLWRGACGVLVITCAGLGLGLVHGTTTTNRPALSVIHANQPVNPAADSPGQGFVAVPVSASGAPEDDWAGISLPGVRPGTLARVLSDEPAGGGGVDVPALKKGDGLEALPVWQRRALMKGNNS